MPNPPPLSPPSSLSGAQPAAPSTPWWQNVPGPWQQQQPPAPPPAAAPAPAPPAPNAPVAMTPEQQQQILQQIGRTGWKTSPYAVPDIQYVANPSGYGAPIPQVRGYIMMVTDDKGNNQPVKLNHAPGSDQEWTVTEAPKALPTAATTVPHLGDEKTGYYTQTGPPGADGKATWVQ